MVQLCHNGVGCGGLNCRRRKRTRREEEETVCLILSVALVLIRNFPAVTMMSCTQGDGS